MARARRGQRRAPSRWTRGLGGATDAPAFVARYRRQTHSLSAEPELATGDADHRHVRRSGKQEGTHLALNALRRQCRGDQDLRRRHGQREHGLARRGDGQDPTRHEACFPAHRRSGAQGRGRAWATQSLTNALCAPRRGEQANARKLTTGSAIADRPSAHCPRLWLTIPQVRCGHCTDEVAEDAANRLLVRPDFGKRLIITGHLSHLECRST